MPNLKLTLKAWPVIALATIGLCFVTQAIAKHVFGIDLPDQANIDLVRRHAGWNRTFAFLCAQVIFLMPAIEECLFRGLFVGLPAKLMSRRNPCGNVRWLSLAVFSSALFSSAHYLAQPWPDAAFIALFFFGLAQCWLYRKTGRLWCPVLNHALFNLTNLILLFVVPA